ncbi:MAG: ABC transporter ATP-binding protein [Alkaliphilus sp.]
MSILLQVNKLTKKYGNTVAANEVTFSVKTGEVVGLIGLNGTGKTTCIKSILGLLEIDAGEIVLDGVSSENRKKLASKVAYISDEPVYFEDLTVSEHITFSGMLHAVEKEELLMRKERTIKMLRLEEHVAKLPGGLSKGLKQKLVIACSVVRDFDILIAAEPFSGLYPDSIKQFKNILLDFKNRGKSILLSTHLLDLAETICDRYVVINKGEILYTGTKKEMITNAHLFDNNSSLEDAFL